MQQFIHTIWGPVYSTVQCTYVQFGLVNAKT